MTRSSLPTPAKPLARVGVARLVLVACTLSLIAMALMAWSLLDPTPFPVMVSMSLGQLVGTLGLLTYGAAVAIDQLERRRRPPVEQKRDSAG